MLAVFCSICFYFIKYSGQKNFWSVRNLAELTDGRTLFVRWYGQGIVGFGIVSSSSEGDYIISFLVRPLLPYCRCRGLLLHLITMRHTHSVGLLWRKDGPVVETSTLHPCPRRVEPAIPASERPQIHVFDRVANGIGDYILFDRVNTQTIWMVSRWSGRGTSPEQSLHAVVRLYRGCLYA